MLWFGMIPITLSSPLDDLFLEAKGKVPVVLLDRSWSELCNLDLAEEVNKLNRKGLLDGDGKVDSSK